MVAIRASRMPLLARCAASAHVDAVHIDQTTEAAEVGTRVHAALAAYIVEEAFCPEDFTDEERILFFVGVRRWNAIKGAFPDPQVEAALAVEWLSESPQDTHTISAHPDVMANPAGGTASAEDWKTTRLHDVDYHDQLMCDLWLMSRTLDPPPDRFQYTIQFLRDDTEITSPVYTVEELDAWRDDTLKPILEWDGVYHPGPHCAYCPIFASCKARAELIESAYVVVRGVDPLRDGSGPPIAHMIEAYRQLKDVKRTIAFFEEQMRAEVARMGGAIAGNGYELRLVESTRDTINVAAGWTLLRLNVPDHELAACLTVKKGDLLKRIADNAPKGKKKAAKEGFMEALRDAGAVEASEFQTLRVFKTKTGGKHGKEASGETAIGTGGPGSS